MFADLNRKFVDFIIPSGLGSRAFALTTRDKDGKKLSKPMELSRKEVLDRLSEVNQQIGKMKLIANKATQEYREVNVDSPEGKDLAKRCTLALEHCAKVSLQNDMLFESIHSSQDPYLMDRKHARYAEQLDEIALRLSSILKSICKD
jgi:hypothetical protein